ncbi:MAG: hypothetical protein FWC40_04120, partial [Proteobacteria bacterium]|nr:hypothetical protein [Pseudomonadota bacterium]
IARWCGATIEGGMEMINKVTFMVVCMSCLALFAFACSNESCEVKRESGKVDAYAQALIDEFYPLNVEQNQADLADFFSR